MTHLPRRSVAIAALCALLALGGCGGDSSSSERDDASAPVEDVVDGSGPISTDATTTTVASWTSAADILSGDAMQALPSLDGFAEALRVENGRLGATDGLEHPVSAAGQAVTLSDGTCTEVGYNSYFWEADVALTDQPQVGILAPSVQVYVCPDEAALSERSIEMFDLHGGTDGLACPVDAVDADGLGTRVCPNQTTSGNITWYNTISLGALDLALVAVTGDLAPDTDTAEGGASFDTLLDFVLTHLAERLG